MREYLISLLTVSAVTAVLAILPSEAKTKRAVSFVLSLSVLCTVVLPLPTLLGKEGEQLSGLLDGLTPEIPKEDTTEEAVLLAVSEGIRHYLAEEYRLDAEELSVTVEGDIVDSTVIVRRVWLTVRGQAAYADLARMVKTVKDNTGAECEVIFENG